MTQVVELVIAWAIGLASAGLGTALIVNRHGKGVRAFFNPLVRRSGQTPPSVAVSFGLAGVFFGGVVLVAAVVASISLLRGAG